LFQKKNSLHFIFKGPVSQEEPRGGVGIILKKDGLKNSIETFLKGYFTTHDHAPNTAERQMNSESDMAS
jgi:hypothetical protein